MTRRAQILIGMVVAAAAAATTLFGGVVATGERPERNLAVTEAVTSRLASGFGSGDTAALVRRLRAAVARDSGGARPQALLGLALQQRARESGDPAYYAGAERALRRALRAGDEDELALRGLASLAASRHRFRDSLAYARRAQRLNPNSAAVLGLIGDAQLELGRYDAAITAFDRAAALKPSATAYARIAYARELLGDSRGAEDAMRLAVDAAAASSETSAWALVQLGNMHLDRGRLAAAARVYRAALARRPGYAPALAGLAGVASDRGQHARAAATLRRALGVQRLPEYAASLGDALAQLGRRRDAERAYATAAVLEKRFAASGGQNALETAMFDLDHDRNFVDALTRARAGHRLRPSIEGEHVLAWALYKNGRCAEARLHSIRALRLGTNDLDGIYHRSVIERCLGNNAAAARFRVRLRSLNPLYLRNPPSARQVPKG